MVTDSSIWLYLLWLVEKIKCNMINISYFDKAHNDLNLLQCLRNGPLSCAYICEVLCMTVIVNYVKNKNHKQFLSSTKVMKFCSMERIVIAEIICFVKCKHASVFVFIYCACKSTDIFCIYLL